jgi:hypothetical protein
MLNHNVRFLPFVLATALLMLCSCESTYVPTVADMPMHRQQGELRANGHFGTNGFDLQASYAATRQLSVGIAANHWKPLGDWSSTSLNIHQALEAKVGFYSRFQSDSIIGVDLRLGYGLGNNGFNPYHKLSFQPSLFISGKHLEYGLASRFVGVSELRDALQPDYYMFYIEPMQVFRFGGERVKMCYQVGWSFALDIDDTPEKPLVMSLGVDVRLNARKRH